MQPRLEVRAHRDNLVHEILNADDAVLPQVVLDNRVLRQRDALLVHLPVTALVDELLHLHPDQRTQVSICFVRFI